jgi:hypothetical protein
LAARAAKGKRVSNQAIDAPERTMLGANIQDV